MATYIALVDFTTDGINNIQYTTQRSRDFAENAKQLGIAEVTLPQVRVEVYAGHRWPFSLRLPA